MSTFRKILSYDFGKSSKAKLEPGVKFPSRFAWTGFRESLFTLQAFGTTGFNRILGALQIPHDSFLGYVRLPLFFLSHLRTSFKVELLEIALPRIIERLGGPLRKTPLLPFNLVKTET